VTFFPEVRGLVHAGQAGSARSAVARGAFFPHRAAWSHPSIGPQARRPSAAGQRTYEHPRAGRPAVRDSGSRDAGVMVGPGGAWTAGAVFPGGAG
jgi:hypothetical protein